MAAATPPPQAHADTAARPPRLRAMLAVSLDGFIAAADGGVEWLDPYDSPEIDFAGFARTIGATVFGRATFDFALRHGQAGGPGRSVVLTHRPVPALPRGVEVHAGDVRDLAARLKADLAGTGKDVWLIGGGRSIDAFHQHGLVDRWELAVIPVVLGDGIPLFPPHARGLQSLRLVHHRALGNGTVELHYEPGPA